MEMTQEELGRQVGLTRTSITNIERGRQRVQVHTLYAIAGALRVQPAELLPGTEVGLRRVADEATEYSAQRLVNTVPQMSVPIPVETRTRDRK